MKKISEENDSKFILLFLNKMPEEKFIKYEKFFKKEEIEYINCYFPEGEKYRVEGEGHPNRIGHKLVSDCLYSQLSLKHRVLLK